MAEALAVLNNNAFSPIAMSRAIRLAPYVPQLLGSLGIFSTTDYLTTKTFELRRVDGKIELISATERGGPIENAEPQDGLAAYYKTPRLAKGRTVQADSLSGVRSIDNPSELETAQGVIADINIQLRQDLEATMEFHRLGAVQGKLIDASGRLLANFYNAFSVPVPTPFDFELDDPTTDVRGKCTAVVRAMTDAAGGLMLPTTEIRSLASNGFFDSLVSHAQVVDTYRYQEGRARREGVAYTTFEYGGITFTNYRNAAASIAPSISIPDNGAIFFPVGAPGIFGRAFSPLESAEFANTIAQEVYAMVIRDRDRDFWFRPEIYSYPIHYCRVPEVLQTAIRY